MMSASSLFASTPVSGSFHLSSTVAGHWILQLGRRFAVHAVSLATHHRSSLDCAALHYHRTSFGTASEKQTSAMVVVPLELSRPVAGSARSLALPLSAFPLSIN